MTAETGKETEKWQMGIMADSFINKFVQQRKRQFHVDFTLYIKI